MGRPLGAALQIRALPGRDSPAACPIHPWAWAARAQRARTGWAWAPSMQGWSRAWEAGVFQRQPWSWGEGAEESEAAEKSRVGGGDGERAAGRARQWCAQRKARSVSGKREQWREMESAETPREEKGEKDKQGDSGRDGEQAEEEVGRGERAGEGVQGGRGGREDQTREAEPQGAPSWKEMRRQSN